MFFDFDEDGEYKFYLFRVFVLYESFWLFFLLRDREDKLCEWDERFFSFLERNKFYFFVLDKIIILDIKVLFERVKFFFLFCEENWFFFDWDFWFVNFWNNKDKEKVDFVLRFILFWYMKKKKIRIDLEGKMDDKKEDYKEEE